MVAVDRREDKSNLSRFREDDGDVRVTHVRRREVHGVTQSVTVSSERTAGRIIPLADGWAAQVWVLTPDHQAGRYVPTFTKLGVFPEKQRAVEAIASAFDWRESETRMLAARR